MGKYDNTVIWRGENTHFENGMLEIQEKIANELAEANRLKIIELRVSKINGKTVMVSDEELKDQA